MPVPNVPDKHDEQAVITPTADAEYAAERGHYSEVEQYADEGVLCVEMEAAATFAVARYRDVDAGALFVVSDHLGTDDWTPQFHDTADQLQRAFELGLDALAD